MGKNAPKGLTNGGPSPGQRPTTAVYLVMEDEENFKKKGGSVMLPYQQSTGSGGLEFAWPG